MKKLMKENQKMKNRILVSMQDGVEEPSWFNNIEPFMQMVMKKLHFKSEEVSIMFCNDDCIKELNKNYRQIDSATDVLSFENNDVYTDEEGKWKCIGDIVISLDTLPVNADYFDENKNAELKRLLVHGLLHLNGYDHGEEHIESGKTPECKMLKKQEKFLEKIKDEKIII